jgi:hypothetical protein
MKQWAVVIFSIVLTGNVFAQFNLETNFSAMSDDNIDNNYLQTADRIALMSAKLSYDWEHENGGTKLSYAGAFNFYSTITDRTFHYHTLELDYNHAFGDDEATTFNANLAYGTRIDRQAYNAYDHQQVAATAFLQHFFTETLMAKAEYTLREVLFDQLKSFNYYEHYVTASGSIYLDTKTTIILRSDLGIKVYISSNMDSTLHSGSGMGLGRQSSSQPAPSVTQISGSLRIGQSILENTGVSLTLQYQTNIQKESRYLSSEYGMLSDDAIFDDHYGYEGMQVNAMLTQILPFDARVRLTYNRQDKSYSSLPAYDLAGIQIADRREDIRQTVTLQLVKEFSWMSLNATYDYIVNSSNDQVYHYTNNALTVGFSVPF